MMRKNKNSIKCYRGKNWKNRWRRKIELCEKNIWMTLLNIDWILLQQKKNARFIIFIEVWSYWGRKSLRDWPRRTNK
jgi:hypothetical protein